MEKKSGDYYCGHADGYDKGYDDGRICALSQLEDHAGTMVALYEDLKKELEYAKKQEKGMDKI